MKTDPKPDALDADPITTASPPRIPRTTQLKLGYLAVLILGFLIAWDVLHLLGAGRNAWIVVCLALLIPGRVQGWLLRDLFRGRRAIARGEWADAIAHLEAMRATFDQHPRRRHALWLGWSVYTVDARAMTLHLLGLAHLHTERPDEAARLATQALTLDPLYPLPHTTLAQLALDRGDAHAVTQHLEHAATLGWRRDASDQAIALGQGALARVEGRE